MSLIDSLLDDFLWQEFLNHKKSSLLPDKIVEDYESYINNKAFQNTSTKIISQDYNFSIPRKILISKNASPEVTIKAMNRKFNRKFFEKSENDLSWKYYFFPIINTTKSLKIVDNYMQDWERYVVTGVHNKKNLAKVPYDFLKKCNYKPLVSEYYNNSK